METFQIELFLSSQGVGLVTGVSGASAAQNGVFHVFDAILGVRHEGRYLHDVCIIFGPLPHV